MTTSETGNKSSLPLSPALCIFIPYQQPACVPIAECISGNGATYAGNASTAESDRPCLAWSALPPYPGLSSALLTDNLCRNPDSDQRPWCFTSQERFEYCDIPACPPFLPTEGECSLLRPGWSLLLKEGGCPVVGSVRAPPVKRGRLLSCRKVMRAEGCS